ncbi:hypothetical protein A2331_07130 [Candidatus Falkowbacteria bacterium RIFOXYB2_FULL_34_18]|uniref:Right handed beta helix domain-containing protein n=1 Tax=Candidatus Falkowbacteria bacterium RIFOXYD2_FULL_34_120 TaxID=1798007 RepID=A0A1F5TSM0_9BACT|nr:MAG: hypothetical protein A2331_07130 [Candidatus Falkowbacteria bacterium RIFOXYB2_FULL_34_18]OGF29909.1 MAG: hypothetical protein A2500_03545 [Candidatus Falkowbacteria bacterium RIFOXYC12_FULL_34_55]OGF37233.1 MAG: hypothetical protein A2466_02970 [Candidatus Falkowbacteria bacterium RIFOXYC2_FULL_34_220]OGF39447.1 MAG: hypothetical protein A2515_03920 [Candidatus Falkowbacteria bacterium RIFOXYD12_FULL_34_57]OGF41571.1 MAG: hypothetical protein A2531_02685 [Candidatus Falkowbacteria bact
MKIPDKLKKFSGTAWPFLGLAGFLIWGWFYVKPLLPRDFFSFENMGDKIAGIFQKEEEWEHPDAKYNFHYAHNGLKPKGAEDLIDIINNPDIAPAGSEESMGERKNISVNSADELQAAVKDAAPGDIIELQPGIYKTNLFIDKDLTIRGRGTSTVIIGGGKGTAVYAQNCRFNLSHLMITDSNSAIKLNNSSGEIRALVIQNNKKSGIELRSSQFAVKGNIIAKNGSYGVFADQDSDVEIEGNYIDENGGFEARIEGKKEIYR